MMNLSKLMPLALVGGLLSTGCVAGGTTMTPSTRFVYPNSNVTPLGEAEGSESKLCGLLGLVFSSANGEDAKKATQQAIDQVAGAEMLIDVQSDYQTANFMVVAICSVRVRGTAAKMEIGKQALYAQNPGAVPEPVMPPAATPVAPAPAAAPAPGGAFAPAAPIAPATGGCVSDNECKGNRVCVQGACTAQ